ncbi:secretion pathway protein Sls2/Rcy1 [Pseudovirgaria hyperparasitica]|uniref:Secretion pathway protein Sls2/Rcy1 n=1 Tax=Pseudovirgaria hyperparasitica TaxID=470096 RepID=A0A6A6WE77_9PEZI|nr:secretion pathway protein Sls2/Rcy1 [Pseudovirgaria hyperparasitica]KAF2759421.1 secretion pathway protein Sls2/Rcy1 [Pseudovirgaria hyperparasitica]
MSNFKRAIAPSPSRVMASLKATQIVATKPILPAELIATILDHLPIADLFRFARTSRRMREMVYDDTRWIARLKSMSAWNETEARQRFEEGLKRKVEAQKLREAEERKKADVGIGLPPNEPNGTKEEHGVGGDRKASTTLFDAGWEEEKAKATREISRDRRGTLEGNFEKLGLNSHEVVSRSASVLDPAAALDILNRVRSIRGGARQEYGKVYGALAPYYFDLARSRSHTDPILFRTYRDPEEQAQMLAQLKVFAKSDFAQGWHERHEKLETMIAVFENAVLREFEQGYELKDVDGKMHRYAHVLTTLNGGAAGVDTFIHNHPLMVDKDILGSPMECLNGVSGEHFDSRPSEDFFRRLAGSVNEQSATIDRVFPPTANVLIPFLERITDEIIADYITTLFDEAHERNIDSYLKAVSGVFGQSLRFSRSIEATKGASKDFPDQVVAIVARAFEPHVDLYLTEELDYFKKRTEAEVRAWETRLEAEEASTESFYMSNVGRQAAKRDFLSSFRKVVMLPVNAVSSIPLSSPFGGTSAKLNASPVTDLNGDTSYHSPYGKTLEPVTPRSSTPQPGERASSPKPEAPTTELAAKAAIMSTRLDAIKSLFSIEVALDLIHKAKTSLERAAVFVQLGGQSGEETKEQCEAIFVQLLHQLGDRHVRTGFDKAVAHLSAYNPREAVAHSPDTGVQPLVTFIELVNVGDLIQQMVDVFFIQELVAQKLVDRDDFLSPAVKEKKKFEGMLDERVAAGLNKGIDVLMDEVEYICGTTQKPSDYNPPVGADLDVGVSETATRIVELVGGHTRMLIGSTEKNMLDVFNQEVGVRLFTVLCKHLKRQRVSCDGAVKLISDTNAYHAYISTLKNKSLTPYFSALRELSQIYLIAPTHAKDIATIIADQDRYYGILRAEDVYEFAERRADWYTVKPAVERAMYGIGCSVM